MANIVAVKFRVDSRRQLDEIERARRFQLTGGAEVRELASHREALRACAPLPRLIESPLVELERQQRMIDQYRRGESPVDHYERVMREQAHIEELMRPTRPGLGVGPHPMSLADMEL